MWLPQPRCVALNSYACEVGWGYRDPLLISSYYELEPEMVFNNLTGPLLHFVKTVKFASNSLIVVFFQILIDSPLKPQKEINNKKRCWYVLIITASEGISKFYPPASDGHGTPKRRGGIALFLVHLHFSRRSSLCCSRFAGITWNDPTEEEEEENKRPEELKDF